MGKTFADFLVVNDFASELFQHLRLRKSRVTDRGVIVQIEARRFTTYYLQKCGTPRARPSQYNQHLTALYHTLEASQNFLLRLSSEIEELLRSEGDHEHRRDVLL